MLPAEHLSFNFYGFQLCKDMWLLYSLTCFFLSNFLTAQIAENGRGIVNGYSIGPDASLKHAYLSGVDLNGTQRGGRTLTPGGTGF